MGRKPTGNPPGPPKKEINLDQVVYWAKLSATAQEIAGSFNVCVDTLDNRLKQEYGMGYSELLKRVDGDSKLSLRRNQFLMSKKNATMAIWLGKQWLGQRDHDDNKDPPLDKNMDFAKLYIESESKRIKLEERLNAIESKTGKGI